MAKISELISKYVISLYNGQIEGVVENVLFNFETKKAKYLNVFNYTNDTNYLLPVDKIYSVGDGAISIKNSSNLTLIQNKDLELHELGNPVNSSVFKTNGDYLGVVTDVNIDDKFNILEITINNDNVVNVNMLANLNSKTTIVFDENNKVNVKNFYERKRFTSADNDTRIVNILQIKDEKEGSEIVRADTPQVKSPLSATYATPTLVPNRAIANYTFLINRKVKRNIMSPSGDLIIKQNTKINANTINIARLNGKLKELTKYSV